MKRSDPFESPKLLLSGARGDIRRLQAAWNHFHERCFGIPFEEFDSENDERVIKFRICPEVPQELRVLASNAFNNLRHLLDQAINCAAVELGSSKRNNYFPFAKDKEDLERVIKSNCPTVPVALLPTIRQFMPHGDGDAELYALSKLCGPNKHQVVLSIDSHMNGMLLDAGPNGWFGSFKGPGRLGALAWDSEKQELEAARVGKGGDAQFRAMTKIPIFVSLSDSDVSRDKPAIEFLELLANKVQAILLALESESQRLKAPQ